MLDCLGIYIEKNIIKYAKVSKDKNSLKINSYGINFYDNLNKAIGQILDETSSNNIPVSINLSNESYNYFEVLSSLSEKDIRDSINTSFDIYCEENNINKSLIESKFYLSNSINSREKLKAVHISTKKMDISNRTELMGKARLTNVVPLPVTISNIAPKNGFGKIAIINLEESTTITIFEGGQVSEVINLEKSINDILEKLNMNLNSYSKAYEVLKNSTIYTQMTQEIPEENREYLEYIMPSLYEIVKESKQALLKHLDNIRKVYITGTGTIINNIDLYFEEYFEKVKCEILRPYFINNISSLQINVKEYIEVNSAVALALEGLEMPNADINFIKSSMPKWLKVEVKPSKRQPKREKESKKGQNKISIKNDLSISASLKDKLMIRGIVATSIMIMIYSYFAISRSNEIRANTIKVNNDILNVQKKIDEINLDKASLESKKAEYVTAKNELLKNRDDLIDKYKKQNSIPNFLNKMMYIIPTGVKITSIKIPNNSDNDTTNKVEIIAESKYYDELGAFVSNLKNAKKDSKPLLSGLETEVMTSELEKSSIKIKGELN